MSIIDILIYIISFAIMLTIIVFIHELGHFLTAKHFGVYCGEFSIGMGPVIFKKQGKETQYSIRAFPVGGFVSMAGEADDTKADADVPFERTINGITPGRRIVVMLAGIFMNIVLAWVILIGCVAAQGSVVVSEPHYTISHVVEDSPAEKSGLKDGDVIINVAYDDGESFKIDSTSDLNKAFGFHPGEKAIVTFKRDKETKTVEVKPKYDKEDEAYYIGIQANGKLESVNFIQAIGYGTKSLGENSVLIFESIGRLVQGKNLTQLSGPVGIFKIAGQAASNGLLYWFRLLAILSVNVGIFNLLPLPILDGGRALITLIEKIVGRTVNEKVMNGLMYFGVACLIILMVFATFNDITKLF